MIYAPTIIMGCGNSMMLVTSLAMVAEIIGDDKVSVWSAFSFHPELPVCTHGTTPFCNSLRFRNVDNLPQEFPLVILLCFLHREGSQEIALTVLRIKTFISPCFPLRPRQAFHYFPSVIHPFWDKRKALEGQSGEFSPWYLDVSPHY